MKIFRQKNLTIALEEVAIVSESTNRLFTVTLVDGQKIENIYISSSDGMKDFFEFEDSRNLKVYVNKKALKYIRSIPGLGYELVTFSMDVPKYIHMNFSEKVVEDLDYESFIKSREDYFSTRNIIGVEKVDEDYVNVYYKGSKDPVKFAYQFEKLIDKLW